MRTWKLPSSNELVAKYIDCYWYCEREANDETESFPKLYPDYCSTLIITDAKQTYDQGNAVHVAENSHWIYPYLNTYQLDHSSPFRLVGIKFKIGALYSLPIPFTPHDLNTVKSIDVTNIFNMKQSDISFILENASRSPHLVRESLDALLVPLTACASDDNHSELVIRVMSILKDTVIKDIGATLFTSQRTVERSFRKVTHLTMKQCQTIMRFEEILDYLHQKDIKQINWSALANEFDYSDQPHLIRSIKQAIGKTPLEYARNRDLTIDIYGDFKKN